MQIAHFILSMSVGGGEKLVRTLSQKVHIPGYTNQVSFVPKKREKNSRFLRITYSQPSLV